ncbi:MAG: InlB B-repeat-containing protein [Campylobacterales bacterium]|nr:InlB B-repeat-containing protein [Campylobacterales bacterium]
MTIYKNYVGKVFLLFFLSYSFVCSATFNKGFIPSRITGKVDVVNLTDNTIEKGKITVGNGPNSTIFSPDGTKVLVSNWSSHTVSVIDTSTDAVIATVDLIATPWPEGGTFNKDGTKAYIAASRQNYIDIINMNTYRRTGYVVVDSKPKDIVRIKDHIYVSNSGSNTVSKIDLSNDSVVQTINTVSNPGNLITNSEQTKLYIASAGENRLQIYDVSTNTSEYIEIKKGYDTSILLNLEITEDGKILYGVNDQYLVKIDLVNKVVAEMKYLGASDGCLSVNLKDKYLYLVCHHSDELVLVDKDTLNVHSTIATSDTPQVSSGLFPKTAQIVENSTPTTYTITYNGNGNTGGSVPADQTKTEDINLTLSTNSGSLTKTNFTFVGWNTLADGSGTDYGVESKYVNNSDITLYAKWTNLVTYTVTFDVDGGSAVSSLDIVSGNTATKPTDPTKTNATFEGWYSDSGLTSSFDFTTAISGDITLYAKWTSTAVLHEKIIDGKKIEAISNLGTTATSVDGDGGVTTSGVTTNSDSKTISVEVKTKNSGEAVHKLEIQTDNVTAEAISKIIGAKTVIATDGSIETNATKDGTVFSVKANTDGTAEHKVVRNGKTTLAKSQIHGESNTTIQSDGSVKTIAKSNTVTLNGYTVKVEILTAADGTTISKYVLINTATNRNINDNPTVDSSTPLEEGNMVNVRESGSEMYIDANTVLIDKIKF